MVVAYNANPSNATGQCGPITDLDVSAITNMSKLFYGLKKFNEDLSNWNYGVTYPKGWFRISVFSAYDT